MHVITMDLDLRLEKGFHHFGEVDVEEGGNLLRDSIVCDYGLIAVFSLLSKF